MLEKCEDYGSVEYWVTWWHKNNMRKPIKIYGPDEYIIFVSCVMFLSHGTWRTAG